MFHLVIVIIVSLSMFVRCEPSPFSSRDCRIQQERENIEVPTKGREQKGVEQEVVEMEVSHPRNPTLHSMQFDFRVREECKKSCKQPTGLHLHFALPTVPTVASNPSCKKGQISGKGRFSNHALLIQSNKNKELNAAAEVNFPHEISGFLSLRGPSQRDASSNG